MADKDLYAVLGVSREADHKQIRKAFRRLARKYHPDLNPGNKTAEQRFKELNDAYEILSDPQKKAKYDTYGSQAFQPGFEGFRTQRTSEGPGFDFSFGEAKDFGNIFENIFGDFMGNKAGARKAPTAARQGEDVDYPLEVDFMEAYQGVTREIHIQRHGKKERLSVKIPAGVSDETRIRLAGKGHPGEGGEKAGDLYVLTKVRSHPFFERKGQDLYCDVPVTILEAALGARIEVPTLDGMATMTLPRGSQSGQTFRLKGKGFPNIKGGGTGDEYVKIKIVLPEAIRAQDEALFKEIGALYRDDPRLSLKR